jgi:curved DNA-binding protein CbpA
MVDPKGYYSILGVSTNSSYTQIKRAYRYLALKYHPDRNKSSMAADMMKKINEAYDVLSDKQKRIDYDNGKDIGHPIRDSHKTYTKYSTYSSDNEKGENSNKSYSYYNNAYYNFNNQSKQEDYLKNIVSVWWQILFSLIPFVNFAAFARIQRLEMAISSLFPILIGIIVLLTIMPGYPFFPLRYEDRFNLFLMLFGGALVFFITRWSIKWNEQIKKGQKPDGDNIDKKVKLITQLMLSLIPFVNFTAFARIYCFQRALVIGIPTYISMVFVAQVITQNNPSLFYNVYLTLTSAVFLVFMYRWTIRYNEGKYNRWADF